MDKWSDPVDLDLSRPISRSLRIEGYSTSVRLESIFWRTLDQIAQAEGMTTASLVGEIYRKVFSRSNHFKNFASLLRVICARHLDNRQRGAPAPRPGAPSDRP